MVLPLTWQGLGNLTQMDVSNNLITGTLPNWNSSDAFPQLQFMDLSANRMSGTHTHTPQLMISRDLCRALYALPPDMLAR